MPERLQRKRVKGWRKPDGAICVTRGTRWGNPFRVGSFYSDRTPYDECPYPEDTGTPFMWWCRRMNSGEWVAIHRNPILDNAKAVELFRRWVTFRDDVWTPEVFGQLRGHDLACWCPLDMTCHADVLLEIANKEEVG